MNNRNRGKNTSDDSLFGSEKQVEILKMAVEDMHYLLSRAYPEKASFELAGNRYRLKIRQIQAIRGASASQQQLLNRKAKEITVEELRGKTAYIDGFNVLILLESLLSGAYIFEGLDGCFRDLSGVHGTYKRVNQTFPSLELVADFFQQCNIGKLCWIFDRPVSNSGRICQLISEFANERELDWETSLEFNPDQFLAECGEIIISSDAWILDHCKKWFNLIRYLIDKENLNTYIIQFSLP
ncbi:DUF434 domain-containing protein [Chryseobacterium salviniae]|uniref:DUF434 domain-containing protein n=1 Tax=Chryseobacterium salviniae TaxID=3101750 RepID=A0ABU6HW44_9FLAO|nr:DUF434 domain-containing protein [Chryseobacterium sp. T9W2-O]MEC3876929.1 DUF434 domain-containing protein [Chryseobacterium sp. T9W2-O]